MLVEIKVPVLAESITDVSLLSWHKAVGDPIEQGQNLVDLETDKVTLEVPAPETGTLKEIRKQTGETAVEGDILAIVDTKITASAPVLKQVLAETPEEAPKPTHSPKLSPSVRKLLTEHKLESTEIPAENADRLTKKDVMAYIKAKQTKKVEFPLASAEETPASSKTSETNETRPRPEQRVPMTRLRQRAAERLLAAQQQNAILTTFNEINMQPIKALRQRLGEDFEAQYGTRVGYMSFFTKAAVEALKRFPIVNAGVDGKDILYHGYYDIGIAVSTSRGLIVPVLRDVDQLSFAQIEEQIRGFGEKARNATLTIEELSGGTFTITNGGIFGSMLSTPIINPPQSAILGMHKIQDRPVVESGEIVIRPIMYLALSYDHRIIDGSNAVQFLVTIKQLLEDPSRMLLGV